MRRLFEGNVDSRAAFNRVITVANLETFTVSYDDLRVRMGPSSFAHARTSILPPHSNGARNFQCFGKLV